MRFVICGAGAVGGVLGGQLAKAGWRVIFIDTMPAHVVAINTHGLQLTGVLGCHTLHIPAVRQAQEVHFQPDDIIILAVKSFHSAAAITALRRATPLELPFFCAQNGIANEALAARMFQHVHGMMILVGATWLAPGTVVHTGHGPIGLGTYPHGLSQVAEEVAAALDRTDLPVYTTDRILPAKWHKLLLNLNNATLGLIGLGSHEALLYPEVRAWMADVWEEGARVLQAAGIAYEGPPGMGAVEERIRELREGSGAAVVPVDEAYQGRSSLWQDLFHRRGEVEAEALNGVVVRMGDQYGVPTPLNSLLLALSTVMAAARELPGKYTIAQLRARLRN